MTKPNWPQIALGTWSWGVGNTGGDQVFGNHVGKKELAPVVKAAMNSGFNLWDTAYAYGLGASETILGNLLSAYPRSQYFLSTKFTPQLENGGSHPVSDMLSGSLSRLHTHYIDLYWIHNPADVEKWTPRLIPLVKSGKVKHVGVSNYNLKQIKRAQEILGRQGIKLDAVQNHYSLLYRSSEKAGILDYCKNHQITFYPYMVLEQGALTGQYGPQHPMPENSDRGKIYNKLLPQIKKLTDVMDAIGHKYHRSIAEVATAWTIQKGGLPIVGVTKEKHIDSQKNAVTLKMDKVDLAKLEKTAQSIDVNTKAGWENSMTD